MKKREVIAYFKTAIAVSRLLNIDAGSISRWKSVPYKHQKKLEKASNGVLKPEPPPERPFNTRMFCCHLPDEIINNFKRLCRKQKIPIWKKVWQLFEDEITKSH